MLAASDVGTVLPNFLCLYLFLTSLVFDYDPSLHKYGFMRACRALKMRRLYNQETHLLLR
jgi:hypothetical protein